MRPCFLLLPLLLAACNDDGGGYSCKDELFDYGIRLETADGRSKLFYPQHAGDPLPYRIGSLTVLDQLDKGPLSSVWVRRWDHAEYSFEDQGSPTVAPGVDANGDPANYYELGAGLGLEWNISASLSFSAPFGAEDEVQFDFHDVCPATATEALSSLIGSRTLRINVAEPTYSSGLIDLDNTLAEIDPGLPGLRVPFTWAHDRGVPVFHSDGAQQEIPDAESEIRYFGAFFATLDQAAIDNLTTKFPAGLSSFGITALAQPSLALSPGDYAFGFQVREGALDLTDTTKKLQIGFVFDWNHDELDNYQAAAPFPKDLYDNSDRWGNGLWDSTLGLQLQFLDATTTPATALSSTARLIQFGRVSLFIAAKGEVSNSDEIDYRVTLFKHTGLFGTMGDPFKVDTAPFVDMPLAHFVLW